MLGVELARPAKVIGARPPDPLIDECSPGGHALFIVSIAAHLSEAAARGSSAQAVRHLPTRLLHHELGEEHAEYLARVRILHLGAQLLLGQFALVGLG